METKRTESTTAAVLADDRNQKKGAAQAQNAGSGEAAGRATGATIGGAIGHVIGVGTDVVAGAVSGGIAAGKHAMANKGTVAPIDTAAPIDPAAEHAFWRKELANRPYYAPGTPYEQYSPAFQYGWSSFLENKGKKFEEVELQLGRDWDAHRGQSQLSWKHVRGATLDAWDRAAKAVCRDPRDSNARC